MAIGFDSDDTIFFHNPLFKDWLKQEQGITVEAFRDYHLWKAWENGTRDQALAFLKAFYASEDGKQSQIIPGIPALLNHFQEQGEELYIVTQRAYAREQLMDAYQEHFPGVFADIIFRSRAQDLKTDIIEKLGITTFFEDAYHHATRFAAAGITTYLRTTDWNRGYEVSGTANLHRVPDWHDALSAIKKQQS